MKTIEWKPLVREDFAEAPWMERLIRPLNNAMGQLSAGVARGLTLGENLNAEIKTVDVGGGKPAVAAVPASPPDTAWHTVGAGGEPAFQNSWANAAGSHAPCRFQRDGAQRVQIQGYVQSGGAPLVFTLPVGYRPAYLLEFDDAAGGVWQVTSAGAVNHNSGAAPASMDSLSFPADDYTAPTGAAGANEVSAFPVKFSTTVRGKAVGLVVLRAVQLSGRDEIAVGGIGGAAWDQNGTTINLRSVTGISAGSTYRLTLLVVGG